jgi:glycosyltransferase involved in cell wall biosynthesis
MRAGLPVVASDVGGIAESVQDGETGYLVPRGDEGLLRDRIRGLLLSPDLRVRLGANGRGRFERHFTLDHFVTQTLAVYREAVAGRGVTERPVADVRAARRSDQNQGSSDAIGENPSG